MASTIGSSRSGVRPSTPLRRHSSETGGGAVMTAGVVRAARPSATEPTMPTSTYQVTGPDSSSSSASGPAGATTSSAASSASASGSAASSGGTSSTWAATVTVQYPSPRD